MADQARNVVRHEAAQQRFVIEAEGRDAGFAEYAERDGVRDYNHTVVLEDFRGQGLSKPLIQAALDAAREDGVKVRPSCSAVAHFIANNPEYQDLLA